MKDETRALAVAALTEYMACALAEYEKPPIRAIIADLAVAGGQAAQVDDGAVYPTLSIVDAIKKRWGIGTLEFGDFAIAGNRKMYDIAQRDIYALTQVIDEWSICRLVPAPVVQGGGA